MGRVQLIKTKMFWKQLYHYPSPCARNNTHTHTHTHTHKSSHHPLQWWQTTDSSPKYNALLLFILSPPPPPLISLGWFTALADMKQKNKSLSHTFVTDFSGEAYCSGPIPVVHAFGDTDMCLVQFKCYIWYGCGVWGTQYHIPSSLPTFSTH